LPVRSKLISSQPFSLDSERIDNPVIGFSAMLLSILLFSLMDANVKWLGASYPTAQIMFFRCAVALLPVLVIIAMRGGIGIIILTGLYTLHREIVRRTEQST